MSPKKPPTRIDSKSRNGSGAGKNNSATTAKKSVAASSAKKAGNGKSRLASDDNSSIAVMAPPSAARAGQDGVEGRYVYGIIQESQPTTFGKTGIGGVGETVYTIHNGDVAAVVSKTAVFIFDPTRENALAHEHVIETVMKSHTIIPMSFGTVFRTDQDI